MGEHCPDHNWYIIGSPGTEEGFLLYGKEDLEVTQYSFLCDRPGVNPRAITIQGFSIDNSDCSEWTKNSRTAMVSEIVLVYQCIAGVKV